MASQDSILSTDGANNNIYHLSLNPSGPETIILLHGLFWSHLEYNYVTPHLQDSYHLLLIDLPGHSRSRRITPFSIATSVTQVAKVIRDHTHNGHAHVVGLSMGGFVARELTIQHPELVSTLFITGATRSTGWKAQVTRHLRIQYYAMGIPIWSPQWLYQRISARMGLLPHEQLQTEQQQNYTFETLKRGFGDIQSTTFEDIVALAKTGVRTLTVAGELQDGVEGAREMGRLLRDNGSPESKAVLAKRALHAWDMQLPELFAQSVRAWIEGKALPEQLEDLT